MITSQRAWAIGCTTFVAAGIYAVVCFSDVLAPFYVGLALAYAFNPVVGWLEKKGLSRGAGAGIVTLGLVLIFALLVTLIIPPLIREGGQFFADFPVYLSKILTQVAEFGERFGIQIPDRDALLERFQNQVRKLASPAALGSAAVVTQRFMAGAGGVLHALFEILILPIFLFLSLKNLPAIQHNLWTLLAPRWRAPVAQRLRKIDNIFAGFIRGQLVVASILACIFSVGLPLLGVKFGFFIGILSGLLNMVPFLGQAIGFLLSMLMVLADFPGWGRVIGIPIFFVVVNFLEGHFLTPKVVGDRVGLTPLQAILALLIGASLAGIVGMIIALPIAGSLKVLWRDLVHWYRHSDFYRKGSSHHTPG